MRNLVPHFKRPARREATIRIHRHLCAGVSKPRRQAFAILLERAKVRKEIPEDIDSDLIFDTMSGIMLYATIFQPSNESWSAYVKRALSLLFADDKSSYNYS